MTAKTNDSSAAAVHPVLVLEDVSETLLCAVAKLKGISDEAISSAISVPKGTVQAYFRGRNVGYREEIRNTLAKFLGVDLMTGRLTSDQVHVFMLHKLPASTSSKVFHDYMQAIGFMLRNSKVAQLTFPCLGLGRRARMSFRGIHVVQNRESRAVFLGGQCLTFRARFDSRDVEGCQWAGGTQKASSTPVEQRILAERIAAGDMTAIEFDEIFRGAEATTWVDVEMTARVNGVNKDEIVEWIETVGARRAIDRSRAEVSAQVADTATELWGKTPEAESNGLKLARAAGGN